MPRIENFKQTNFTDRNLTLFQDNVNAVINQISGVEILQGQLLSDINISSTATNGNPIEHKLGRKPLGWFVVLKGNASDIWQDQSLTTRPDLQLVLKCSADVKISLWVF